MTIPARKEKTPLASTVEAVLIRGDLSKLTEEQRLEYYNSVCKTCGLNPLTRPFEYLELNGKLQLYARKDCTDQLRKINSITLEIVSQDFEAGLLTVHVRAKDATGRTDEDIGSVAFPDNLKGEFAANMRMKAVTKAKRRTTLSICGLGFLDETEVEDIPESAKALPPKKFREPESGPHQLPHDQSEMPRKLSVPSLANNAGPDYRAFATELIGIMRSCPDTSTVFDWQQENQSIIDDMAKRVPKMRENLVKAIEEITSEAS